MADIAVGCEVLVPSHVLGHDIKRWGGQFPFALPYCSIQFPHTNFPKILKLFTHFYEAELTPELYRLEKLKPASAGD